MDTEEIDAKVSCAYCGAELLLPPCEEGQHVQCPYCYSKCEYSNGLLYRLQGAIISQKEMRKVHTSCRPTAPKTIVLSVIMIYALAALGFIGTASQNFMAAASVGALLSGLGRGVQIGKGWTRIVLTIVIGATWVFSCAMNPVMGLVIALLWSSPVILIWLPGSCIWFGEMRIWYQEERLRHIESVKRRNAILIEIGILLLALICIYSSGLCQFALYNGIDAPLEWKMALLAFIPIMPILALLSFVGSMFCDDMPFWLGTLNIVLMGLGWGLLEEFCSRMKKNAGRRSDLVQKARKPCVTLHSVCRERARSLLLRFYTSARQHGTEITDNRAIWPGEGQLKWHFGSDQSVWRDGEKERLCENRCRWAS